jgi:CRISPR-associated protein Cas1
MIKRTLYFGNPAFLSTRMEQLVIESKETTNVHKSIPIEDIGILILDHQQITITLPALNKLLENNVAVITCDDRHHPLGMFYVLESHTLQSQKFKYQIDASAPLKKQLWQQIIKHKIANQAAVLDAIQMDSKYLSELVKHVKSGDTTNCEAKAAAYYWKIIFSNDVPFTRFREGAAPNNLLNYGYAILRAITARSIVAAGLMPTLGIFHRNQYNAFCLADDLMEPYRPFVDMHVVELVAQIGYPDFLTPDIKKSLLQIPVLDVNIDGQLSPLSIAVQRSAFSLAKCFEGVQRKLILPDL